MVDMKIIDKLLRLRERQMVNDNLKSVLYFKCDRFYDLFSEIQTMTMPLFTMPEKVWDFWLREIMPQFVDGDDLLVLGYTVKKLDK